MYLDKDDHVPNRLNKYDVRATLAQLLVVWETDLEQSGRVLQLLHVCLYYCYRSIGLGGKRHFKTASIKTGLTFELFVFVRYQSLFVYHVPPYQLICMAPPDSS